MIWHPKPGQKVKAHYRKSAKYEMPCHGLIGEVVAVSKGPGPINVKIRCKYFDIEFCEIIPRGNLIAIK